MSPFHRRTVLASLIVSTSALAQVDGVPRNPVVAWTLHAAADERIDRVENGLREPVAVRGAPARTMRLADRMRDLHVPGVSIAVIDHGRIAWTRALLSHTAGVSGEDLVGYPATASCPALRQELEKAGIVSVPGSRFAYSSLGYGVLQQVLVDATGQPFDALARAAVFAPLGMRDSLFASMLPAALAPRAASGHALDGKPIAGG